MPKRPDTPLEAEIRRAVEAVMERLIESDPGTLKKAGIYPQRLNKYRHGRNLPNNVGTIAVLYLLRHSHSLTLVDPESANTWIMRWQKVRPSRDTQLSLPLPDMIVKARARREVTRGAPIKD